MKEFYIIKNITNMHVGSGDINFDIVDNQVQKEGKLPIIHSSSLKGALREHFEKKSNFIKEIFGDEDNPGSYIFFESRLLTRPVRSNKRPYFNAASPEVIKELIDMLEVLDVYEDLKKSLENFYNQIKDIKEITLINSDFNEAVLEDEIAKNKTINIDENIKKLGLSNLAIYPFEKFQELELPVIARNKIDDNGKSENLWYEEIVPRGSSFYTFIIKSSNEEANKEFDELLKEVIQIGANKSIGYGFCEFKRIEQ